jgi:hypothetical protein
MLIRNLNVSNFRGIKSLNWNIQSRIVCLLGQNDSTKTTILDALELGLWPRPYYSISDADFHKGDTTHPIRIEVTVGELPDELLREDKFGLFLRGFSPVAGIADDPADGLEPVVTVCCEITADLEPAWVLLKASALEPRPLRWRDRELLGAARLGAEVDRHFTWARGSALGRMTDGENPLGSTLASVSRAAREAVAVADLPQLHESSKAARNAAMEMGAQFAELVPGMDIANLTFGNSLIGLHQDKIPLRLWGLGTKRLAALAIQQSGTGAEAALLIDEIEHGLEPHRIRHLLKKLSKDADETARQRGQVILTSHSPTTAMTLNVTELGFVRRQDSMTTVTTVEPGDIGEVQAVIRAAPYALFGRKLVVCEGATEVGLCRGLEKYWAAANGGVSPANLGLVLIDGCGCTQAPGRALALKKIGYDVIVLADSDQPLKPDETVLKAAGVEPFLWSGGLSTEERLAHDLPSTVLQELIDAAVTEFGDDLVVSHVVSCCATSPKPSGVVVAAWISGATDEGVVRRAIGRAAKTGTTDSGKGWFKNVSFGERLGEITGRALPGMSGTPTFDLLSRLMQWIYD